MLEKGVYHRLTTGATALAAVIGATTSARIYPDLAPVTAVAPYLVYSRVATRHVFSKSNDDGLARGVIQINSVSTTKELAKTLADLVRRRLVGFRGTLDGVFIKSIQAPEVDMDATEMPTDGTEKPRWRVVQQYPAWFVEATPD